MAKNNKVYVIGHKNPDTDSICSAISYAYLKNQISEKNGDQTTYIASRAGHINEETQFVLKYFNAEHPQYIADIRPQVTDIEINRPEGIDRDLSLKNAWYLMRRKKIVSLPILDGEKLDGIITIGDIALSNMDVYDNICMVPDDNALDMAKRLAKEEGILCGISSGTNVVAALMLAEKLGKGKTVVTVLPDTAERYFSTPLFEGE